MESGRFVILVGRHAILTKSNEARRIDWLRDIVTPDRVEFVQLIVQCVAAIFSSKKGRATAKSQIVKTRMISVAQDDEANGAAFPTGIEVKPENAAPSAPRCQLRI